MGSIPLLEPLLALWRRHWWLDLVVGFGGSAIAFTQGPVGLLHSGSATDLYITVVTASAALGALALTPIAIILAMTPGPRLRSLLKYHVESLRRSMAWTVFANLIAALVGILGVALDQASDPMSQLRFVALAVEFSALLAMVRLVWFFVRILYLGDRDSGNIC